jgi:hypothetical protein
MRGHPWMISIDNYVCFDVSDRTATSKLEAGESFFIIEAPKVVEHEIRR